MSEQLAKELQLEEEAAAFPEVVWVKFIETLFYLAACYNSLRIWLVIVMTNDSEMHLEKQCNRKSTVLGVHWYMGFGPNFVTSFQYYLGQTTLFFWVLVIATVELCYQID